MRDCPDCGKAVDGLSCRCGWKDASAPPTQVDRDRWLCANVERGHRCASLGTLSMSTNGSGPWFCHRHFPLFAKDHGLDPDAKEKLREAVRKSKPHAISEFTEWTPF